MAGSGRLGLAFECDEGQEPRVSAVEPGSPAEAAGIRVNDRVQCLASGASWGRPLLGISQDELVPHVSAAAQGGQVVLQIARRDSTHAAVSVFSAIIRPDHRGRGPCASEPRWIGHPDNERIQLADGSKRDRDFFETGADIVDSLWAKPKSKHTRNVLLEPRTLATAGPQQQTSGTVSYAGWDPLRAHRSAAAPQRQAADVVFAPRNSAPAVAQQQQTSDLRTGIFHYTDAWDPFGVGNNPVLQPQAADVEHTRRQRLKETPKGLWSPAGEVRKTGVSQMRDTQTRDTLASGLPVSSEVQTPNGSDLSSGLERPVRPPRGSGVADWYLVQHPASQPYSSSLKLEASNAQERFTPDGYIDVVVLHAHNLPMATSPFGLCDAYCTARMDTSFLSTRVVNNTVSPVFNTILRFAKSQPQTISIRVINKTLLGGAEIGAVTVPWEDVQSGQISHYPLLSGEKRVLGANQAPSRLTMQVLIGPGAVGGLLDATSRGSHGLQLHHSGHQDLIHASQGQAVGPAHMTSTEGVTLTVDQDYAHAKHNEQVWQSELKRDVCKALRCDPARFQYVGLRQGSVLAIYNVLPPGGGDADQRTARNLVSELTLQAYDAKSPLKTFPTTAKIVKANMHAPHMPREGPLGLGVPVQLPQTGSGGPLRDRATGGKQRVVFGTNSYSVLLEKSLDAFGVDKAKGPQQKPQGDATVTAAKAAEAAEPRPAFGAEAILPVMNRVLGMSGSGHQGADAATSNDPSIPTPATLKPAPYDLPGVPAADASSSSGVSAAGQAAPSMAAVRMRLGMPFDEAVVGHDGSSQREAFKTMVTKDLSVASGLPDSAFNIVAVSRGSVIIDTEIRSPPGRDALAVALDLQSQARCALPSFGRARCTADVRSDEAASLCIRLALASLALT